MRARRPAVVVCSCWLRRFATALAAVVLGQTAAQGAPVSLTLKGEVELPHATLTTIERNTYDEKLKQLHAYLANVTGLGEDDSDYITASFGLSDNPVRANFSWDKVLNSSLVVDLGRLRNSGVLSVHINVGEESPPHSVIDSKVAVALIAALASLLFLLLVAAAGYAVRAKWRRSSVGVIPAMDVLHRRGGGECGSLESGTYRMRKLSEPNSGTGGELVGDSMPKGDEAAIIRAWVQAQLRESHAAKHQQQHPQVPKRPKRFSFRLIGKSVDHFDSGVEFTSKSTTRSCDAADDDTLTISANVKSADEVGAASQCSSGVGWMQHNATENTRAPIYKKNRPCRAASATSAAASDAAEPPDDGDEAEVVEATAGTHSPPDAFAAESESGDLASSCPTAASDAAANTFTDVHRSDSAEDAIPSALREAAVAHIDGNGYSSDREIFRL